MAPMSSETISRPRRGESRWISRASISLPVPFSPVMRMFASVTATRSTSSRMRVMARLVPQNIASSASLRPPVCGFAVLPARPVASR